MAFAWVSSPPRGPGPGDGRRTTRGWNRV